MIWIRKEEYVYSTKTRTSNHSTSLSMKTVALIGNLIKQLQKYYPIDCRPRNTYSKYFKLRLKKKKGREISKIKNSNNLFLFFVKVTGGRLKKVETNKTIQEV